MHICTGLRTDRKENNYPYLTKKERKIWRTSNFSLFFFDYITTKSLKSKDCNENFACAMIRGRRKGGRNSMDKEQGFQLMQEYQVQELLKGNEFLKQYDLCLSRKEAELLLGERRRCLSEQQRVEFGEGILKKLLFEFCDSPYLEQEQLAETLAALQEIFYLYKNESLEELTDEELLSYMKEKFDGECRGDLEYLSGTVLEEFARTVRKGTRKYIGRYRENGDGI